MFDERCSIYAKANDNYGRYVDVGTGQRITEMTIRDFCLTDRWKKPVCALRDMIAAYGVKAKKMEEYRRMKETLPGATMSGLFELRDDVDKRTGEIITRSRCLDHLKQHTGWLVLDIDLGDNEQVEDFEHNILSSIRFRPEVALMMKSCSGTGYFGLVRLAKPELHKQQFRALQKEYEMFGIQLDNSCSDVTRVRFASWDEHPYINERAIPYRGIELDEQDVIVPSIAVQFTRYAPDTSDITYRRAARLVEKIEACAKDITGDYKTWIAIGMSLHRIDPVRGYDLWKRVSAFWYDGEKSGMKESDFSKPWKCFNGTSASGRSITEKTFFGICKNFDFFLSGNEEREIRSMCKM